MPKEKPIENKVMAKQTNAKKVKDYLKSKGMSTAKLNKEKWTTPDEIIESVVKLHGGMMEAYRGGGLN